MSHATPGPRSPDLILYNGKIVTVDSSFTLHEAVSIRDGIIIDVGPSERLLEDAVDSTRVIDLQGRCVIPGLIEGHAHPVAASQSELHTPIPVVNSIGELLNWIAKEAAFRERDQWIIHPKCFITRMKEMRPVSIAELDSVAPDHPVFLNGSYGGMINSNAFEVSKLTRES